MYINCIYFLTNIHWNDKIAFLVSKKKTRAKFKAAAGSEQRSLGAWEGNPIQSHLGRWAFFRFKNGGIC